MEALARREENAQGQRPGPAFYGQNLHPPTKQRILVQGGKLVKKGKVLPMHRDKANEQYGGFKGVYRNDQGHFTARICR